MGIINTPLLAIILALSPIVGYFLGRSVKEELAVGKKWFILAQHCLFIAIIATFLYAYKWQLWQVVIGLTTLFAYFLLKFFRKWWLVQAMVAIAFVLTARTSFVFLSTSLVFLYGLPTGTIFAKEKKFWISVLAGVVFFVIAVSISFLL